MSFMIRRRIAARGPINPRHRLWTKKEDRLLGTQSDTEIGAKLRRSPGAVRSRRRALDIQLQAAQYRLWAQTEEKQLGTASDVVIARKLGRNERGVELRRRAFGIPPYRSSAPRR